MLTPSSQLFTRTDGTTARATGLVFRRTGADPAWTLRAVRWRKYRFTHLGLDALEREV